jgi:hypothetical protein
MKPKSEIKNRGVFKNSQTDQIIVDNTEQIKELNRRRIEKKGET